jgi:acylphosphatase
MRKHFSARVRGDVQGIFFRQFVLDQANTLGISGFVRNEPDGSVYLEAEGEEKDLEKLLSLCQEGPRGAIVEGVERTPGQIKNFTGFKIEY